MGNIGKVACSFTSITLGIALKSAGPKVWIFCFLHKFSHNIGQLFRKKIFFFAWQFLKKKIKMCLKNHYFGHKTCCWASMRLKLRYVHIICIRISFKKKNWRSLNPPKSYEKRPLQPLIEAEIFFWCFHWIPGEILTYLKKKSFSVAPKTPKLACLKHLGPLPPPEKTYFFFEKIIVTS